MNNKKQIDKKQRWNETLCNKSGTSPYRQKQTTNKKNNGKRKNTKLRRKKKKNKETKNREGSRNFATEAGFNQPN